MKIIADFHIHSKYSRATSKDMDLEELNKWAKIKGITVLGTGDFTHPFWLKNLKSKLEPAEKGLFKLKNEKNGVRFILTAEISSIYKKLGKVRKIHTLIFSPSFEACDKIIGELSNIGNLKSDGRPILGLDAKILAQIVLNASPDCMVIPAHAWTPWFSVFGSKSGFNSLEECFDDYTKYIYAIETGLSSDPAMNWRISGLDKIALISNSDCHSPKKIGREANVFDVPLSYSGIMEAIKSHDDKRFLFTIEFFPEEGKYHYDGHRVCGVSLKPSETKRYKGICPVCKKPLIIGVLNRVEELVDRPEGGKPVKAIPFKSIIPLAEIIGDALQKGVSSKAVISEYDRIIKKLGTEFYILLESPFEELLANTSDIIADGIMKVRSGKVNIEPGYDGVYGKISIFPENSKKFPLKQKSLFEG